MEAIETISLSVNLRAFVRRDTRKRWVATCPRIGVASQGVSEEDAKRSLREAVELWFESCVERGVLDQAMRESNMRPLQVGEPLAEALASASESVVVSRSVREAESQDLLGDDFAIQVTIPAYQASHFLGASA